MKTCPKSKCLSKRVHFFTMDFYEIGICKDCGNYFYNSYRPEYGCCSSPSLIDVIKYHSNFSSNGRPNSVIYEQCRNCGWTQKRFPKKAKDADVRGEYNEIKHAEWINKKEQETLELIKEAKIINSFWYEYNKYLSSNKWKKIREDVFQRDMKLCQICKKETASEVHHLHYKNVFNENLDDLISICYACHIEQHTKEKLIEIKKLKNG